ncbi:MAG TPA: DNA-directed RNA polymerase subunit omega [Pyrinomonadaceae bacterium]|nr:DNA-directed RNA polymerase subunit omega [Pyrinomonadaceae bacterium]
MSILEETEDLVEETPAQEIDSKYRLIILAAKRSKQLQRGAKPRIDIDSLKHKNTRIALEEVVRGRVHFTLTDDKTEK